VTRSTRSPLHDAVAAACLVALAACQPARYQPSPVSLQFELPKRSEWMDGPLDIPSPGAAAVDQPPAPEPAVHGPLALDTVIDSVTRRYPPYLSTLLEKDLASGRLTQAMGAFDTTLGAKGGGQVQGYYGSTFGQSLLEQPLATGDTVYGGYRISDGSLPDYDKNRTQDSGELVFGGRVPLLRDRSIDRRRAGVRQAEIDVMLADPVIARARIDYVRAATRTYWTWVAAGQRLTVARQLLRLATDRVDALRRGVERQFLAPIDIADNERLIAQRQVFVVNAERQFQQVALEMSLFLRDAADQPIVAAEDRLPQETPAPDALQGELRDDASTAIRQRPELRRFQLVIDRARTDLELAENQTMPNLDLVVEAARSLSDGPYTDKEDLELFVGGELKLPLQRRDALGRREQAVARVAQALIDEKFSRERIVNEVTDARSAVRAAFEQIESTKKNVALARELVAAEQRAFDLGRSDLLRIQLREVQLADAEAMALDAMLAYRRARADLRAALGHDAIDKNP
jgi:outer membrane protein TolC